MAAGGKKGMGAKVQDYEMILLLHLFLCSAADLSNCFGTLLSPSDSSVLWSSSMNADSSLSEHDSLYRESYCASS